MANRFRLHCSLLAATGRMFVHASEELRDGTPVAHNIQILGLQLQKYTVAGPTANQSWRGEVGVPEEVHCKFEKPMVPHQG